MKSAFESLLQVSCSEVKEIIPPILPVISDATWRGFGAEPEQKKTPNGVLNNILRREREMNLVKIITTHFM